MQLSIIQSKIYEIRGHKVMLDFDLAALYDVHTKIFNQAVKRNSTPFPPDFKFQLEEKEFESLRSQIVTSNRGGRRYAPFAFTEQGVAMLSSVLNSEKAIEANIVIMRTFVLIRQHALEYKDLAEKIKKLENKYNKNFKEVFAALELLMQDKQEMEELKNRTPIGYILNQEK
jgi:hypothetical protein